MQNNDGQFEFMPQHGSVEDTLGVNESEIPAQLEPISVKGAKRINLESTRDFEYSHTSALVLTGKSIHMPQKSINAFDEKSPLSIVNPVQTVDSNYRYASQESQRFHSEGREHSRNSDAKLQEHSSGQSQKDITDSSIEQEKQERANDNDGQEQCRIKINKFLDHWAVVTFLTALTIYALFFDDIRVIAFTKEEDDIFYGITLFAMITFTVEIILASYSQYGYFLGFFFWLDFISILSLVPDCGWIWDPITGEGDNAANQTVNLAKTSRASKLTKIVRVIRLIRLIRIVKLYKQAQQASKLTTQIRAKRVGRTSIVDISQFKYRRSSLGISLSPSLRRRTVLSGNHDHLEILKNIRETCTDENQSSSSSSDSESQSNISKSASKNLGSDIGGSLMSHSQSFQISSQKHIKPLRKDSVESEEPGVKKLEFTSLESSIIRNNSDTKPKVKQNTNLSNTDDRINSIYSNTALINMQDHDDYEEQSPKPRLSTIQSVGSPQKGILKNAQFLPSIPQQTFNTNDEFQLESRINTEDLSPMSPSKVFKQPAQGGDLEMDEGVGGEEKEEEAYFQMDQNLGMQNLGESKISKTLSEKTIKTVLVLTLTMLFVQQFFSLETYVTQPTSFQLGLIQLSQILQYGTQQEYLFSKQKFIEFHSEGDFILFYLETPKDNDKNNGVDFWETNLLTSQLRLDEYDSQEFYNINGQKFLAIYEIRIMTKLQAILSISRTIFICFVLSIAAVYFTKDANELVLNPIERMIEKVRILSRDPTAVQDEEEFKKLTILSSVDQKSAKEIEKLESQDYETSILENAITKIGKLLALGFGEAGSAIIGENISKEGDLNPMISGEKILAIFGFCDIRNFTDSTEVLQEGVMTLVNKIADIVHYQVSKYGGSANKNIGDAFLLVWKFDPAEVFYRDGEPFLRNQYVSVLIRGDMALFSFIKIIAKINSHTSVLEYRQDARLKERVPGFKVKMGFGLHYGWAIEGAIGSEYKIDASYLSPNVNIAARLEAATKQYGVQVLLSGDMYELLTPESQVICREIDTVTVKGSSRPIRLFTVDLFDSLLPPNLRH